jgi:hypothetical protein
VRTFSYGTAARNSDGTLSYTRRGTADAGHFDLNAGTVTVRVDVAALNALQTRAAIGTGTELMGLRGSAAVSVVVPGAASAAVLTDSTRAGRPFVMNDCAGQ